MKDISVDSYLESNYDVQSLIWNIKNTIKHKQEEIKLKSDLKNIIMKLEMYMAFYMIV